MSRKELRTKSGRHENTNAGGLDLMDDDRMLSPPAQVRSAAASCCICGEHSALCLLWSAAASLQPCSHLTYFQHKQVRSKFYFSCSKIGHLFLSFPSPTWIRRNDYANTVIKLSLFTHYSPIILCEKGCFGGGTCRQTKHLQHTCTQQNRAHKHTP